MRRRLAALAVLPLILAASGARAASNDPVGDLIMSVVTGALPSGPGWNLKATLYHAGAKGVGALDALGCKVVAMRTVAIDTPLLRAICSIVWPCASWIATRDSAGVRSKACATSPASSGRAACGSTKVSTAEAESGPNATVR